LPIRPIGSLPPLFCIHPVAGLSWPYSRLIGNIPPGHPIYGLQARNLVQRQILPDTIESMATDYLSVIRRIQAVGPYNLLGWSFGGLVAHAVATQLQSMGEQVSTLALLDSYPFDEEGRASISNDRNSEPVTPALAHDPVRAILERVHREGSMHSPIGESDYEAISHVYANDVRIMRKYSPRRFTGDILLFVANEGAAKPSFRAWTPYIDGRIQVYHVDCDHDSMMDALPARSIGEVLARDLDKQRRIDQPGYPWRTK
jgi:thioesterase domain-containing protein